MTCAHQPATRDTAKIGVFSCGRNLQHREDRRGVKIDVGAKLFLALHRRFEILADRHPLLLAERFPRSRAISRMIGTRESPFL